MTSSSGVRAACSDLRGVYDVIILGAGISGLTLAHDFVSQGMRVLLLEEYPEAGGNHKSRNIGQMSFDIGAIFFWTDYPQFEMFPGLREAAVPAKWSLQRITPTGEVSRYPFDLKTDILQRRVGDIATILLDIAVARAKGLKRDSAASYLEYHLGQKLMQSCGILNYVEKFYGAQAHEITYDFAEARMRAVASAASVRGVAKRQVRKLFRRRRTPSTSCVARPHEGFGAYYAKAVEWLKAQGVTVRLGSEIGRIEKGDAGMSVLVDGRPVQARRLVSTLPLARTSALAGEDGLTAPRSKGLHTLFCKFRGERGFDALILYNFHVSGRWKRLTMHSDYYDKDRGWEYMSVEVTADTSEEDPQALFDDFRATTRQFGLFDGELQLAGSEYTAFAYPVYDHQSAQSRDEMVRHLSAHGIELAGRQGQFQYLPTSAETAKHVRVVMAGRMEEPARPCRP